MLCIVTYYLALYSTIIVTSFAQEGYQVSDFNYIDSNNPKCDDLSAFQDDGSDIDKIASQEDNTNGIDFQDDGLILKGKLARRAEACQPSGRRTGSSESQNTDNLTVGSDQKKCDANSKSFDGCWTGKYLIYPVKCAGAKNHLVPDQLQAWRKPFETSVNRVCGGTLFWLVHLSQKEINELLNQKDIVEAIVPDTYGKEAESIRPRRISGEDVREEFSINSFSRRDNGDSVVIQSNAPPHLSFVSRSSNKFLHFSNAGKGITLYILDQGVHPQNSDFTTKSVIKKWIHALYSSGQQSDSNGHGTCVLSCAAGIEFGAVKEMKAVVVKIGRARDQFGIPSPYIDFAGFLDGLQKIIDDLQDRVERNEKVQGYTIVNITFTVESDPQNRNIKTLKSLLRTLIDDYQVVITVAAGNYDPRFPKDRVITAYPPKFAPGLPLVVVGGIDMNTNQLDSGSLSGSQISILAPYSVRCARNEPFRAFGYYEGTSFSASIVAGVLGGMMSGEWGDLSRAKIGTPGFTMSAAARTYIRAKGTKLTADPTLKAVDNGLDGRKLPPLYGWRLCIP